jgi:hypothetical protein
MYIPVGRREAAAAATATSGEPQEVRCEGGRYPVGRVVVGRGRLRQAHALPAYGSRLRESAQY